MRITLSSIFALLITASISNAQVTVNTIENGEVATGVFSYTVQLVAPTGGTISTVSGFTLTNAHQIWDNAAGNGTTPNFGDTEGTFGNAAWTPLDTHLLALPGFNESPNWTPVETNDATNPAGVDLAPSNPGFSAFPGTAGMGDLVFTDSDNPANNPTSGIAFLAPQPTTLDFLQIIVPAGETAVLNMTLEDGAANQTVITDLMFTPGGGGMDPVFGSGGGTIPSDGTGVIDLQGAWDNLSDLLADALTVTGATITQAPTIDNAIFQVADWDADSVDIGIDRPLAIQNPPGVQTGVLEVVTDQGTFEFTVSANVPEPSTIVLIGLAAVGFVGYTRRRK